MKLLTASVEGRRKVPELRDLIKNLQPQVVTMTQAYNIGPWAKTFSDYNLSQFPLSMGPEATAVAVLLRHDVEIWDVRSMSMTRDWFGPVHGNHHEPRIYPVFKLTYKGKSFNFIGVHAPTANNKLAQAETWNRLERFYINHPYQRNIILGDLNATVTTLQRALPPFTIHRGAKVDHLLTSSKVSVSNVTRHEVPEGLHGFVSFNTRLESW